MKFFTMQWWAGDDETHDPVTEYPRHIQAIRTQLPVALFQFAETINLHDSHLLRLDTSFGNASATLTLDVLVHDPALNTGVRRRASLVYDGVTSISSSPPHDAGLGGPHGYGDLGYDEVDLAPDGSFEHRMLFSSGIELQLRFSQFAFMFLPP